MFSWCVAVLYVPYKKEEKNKQTNKNQDLLLVLFATYF